MRFTSAREAICYYLNHQLMTPENDISKLFVKVQHTARGGSGRMWLGLELGDMCRDLNERNLGKAAYTWALYAYGGATDENNWQDQKRKLSLIRYVLDNYPRKITAANVLKVSKLAECAVDDFIALDINGKSKFTPAQICAATGIKQANWVKVWQPNYIAMQDVLDRLSARCLGVVAARLRVIEVTSSQDSLQSAG